MKGVLKMKFENKINDTKLNEISGGTLSEVYDLAIAMVKNQDGEFAKFVAGLGKFSKSIEGHHFGGSINIILKNNVSQKLNEMGIDNNLSVGIFRTGINDDPNVYKKDGKTLTHYQVMEMID